MNKANHTSSRRKINLYFKAKTIRGLLNYLFFFFLTFHLVWFVNLDIFSFMSYVGKNMKCMFYIHMLSSRDECISKYFCGLHITFDYFLLIVSKGFLKPNICWESRGLIKSLTCFYSCTPFFVSPFGICNSFFFVFFENGNWNTAGGISSIGGILVVWFG